MSKKIVIRADLVGKKCKSQILSVVAKLEGIKSMDIDPEKCTLTVVGTVDPVCVVQMLWKACFAATIVSVEDDKPKEKKNPCQEACEKACKDKCEKACKDACCCESGYVPSCHYYGYSYGVRAPPVAMGYRYHDEERSPGAGGECAIQ